MNKKTGRTLKPNHDKYGYLYYVLCMRGCRKTVKAHRLVAMAFISNPQNKPTINHKNGIRDDNRVQNLEWATHKEQSNDPLTYQKRTATIRSMDHRKFISFGNNKRVTIILLNDPIQIMTFDSAKAAARHLKISYSKLSEILNGKRKQRSWFHAKWYNSEEE